MPAVGGLTMRKNELACALKNDKYILDARGKPVPEPDLFKWGAWFQENTAARIVARTKVGASEVSTVFLGLDHSFRWGLKPVVPVLWETMVFGGPMDQEMDRCAGNREQAEAMHEQMVERVKAGPPRPGARG